MNFFQYGSRYVGAGVGAGAGEKIPGAGQKRAVSATLIVYLYCLNELEQAEP